MTHCNNFCRLALQRMTMQISLTMGMKQVVKQDITKWWEE